MFKIIEDYKKTLQAIYNHVGFVEDWVVYPIDDNTEMYWTTDDKTFVRFALVKETLLLSNIEKGKYFESEIYTQRFYTKWVYEGKDFTMIFCDTHTDGMKYFSLFDNSKRIEYTPNN